MTEEDDAAKRLIEIEKMRFEFAWRHFEFHARQRTTMFHFFILLMPFVFGGYFYFFRPEVRNPSAALFVAVAGFLLSATFGLLDARNRELYRVSQRNLMLLEKDLLYRPDGKALLDENGTPFGGIITEEKGTVSKKSFLTQRVVRHAFLMAFIHAMATLSFLALAIYAYLRIK